MRTRHREVGVRMNTEREAATFRATVGLLLALALFSPVAADTLFVSISDSLEGTAGDTLTVPVLIQDQVGAGVIGVDMTLTFRESVLQAQNWQQAGRPANGWMVVVNPLPGSLLVAMAGATELQEGDTLLLLRFEVLAADTSPIAFNRCRMNEGQVACSTRNGMFWPASGVEEGSSPREGWQLLASTVSTGGVLYVFPVEAGVPIRLLDCTGRELMTLSPGENDIRHVAPGVYFVRQEDCNSTTKAVVRR